MPAPIITIMDDLVSAAPSTLMFPVTAMSKRRWMIETDAGPVVQLECLDSPNRALIYATAAGDGSGPLRAAFTTMLLLEDTIAINLGAHGVCSGDATVTVYRFINLEGVSAETIGLALTEFAHFAAALLARRGIGLPGARRDDDHEISELNILD